MVSSSPLVSFLIALLMAAAVCIQGQEELVRDTAGNSLETGQRYFIQPVSNGGGLVPAASDLPLCPLNIVQGLIPTQPGLPVIFALPNSDTTTNVTTSTNVTIEFKSEYWPVCKKISKLWQVDTTSTKEEPLEILLGGERGSVNSNFTIVKIGQADTYKLTTFKGNVVTLPTGGIFDSPKLVVTGNDVNTLVVKFKKVDVTTTSTSRIDKLGLRMFQFY